LQSPLQHHTSPPLASSACLALPAMVGGSLVYTQRELRFCSMCRGKTENWYCKNIVLISNFLQSKKYCPSPLKKATWQSAGYCQVAWRGRGQNTQREWGFFVGFA